MKKLLLVLVVTLSFLSCGKKNVDCDATLCLKNNSNDTVRYCRGCNSYSQKIAPNSEECFGVGHIKIKKGLFGSDESTTNVSINTPGATYVIPVDECNEERIIE